MEANERSRITDIWATLFQRCLAVEPLVPSVMNLDRRNFTFKPTTTFLSQISSLEVSDKSLDSFIIYQDRPNSLNVTIEYDLQCGTDGLLLELLHRRTLSPVIYLPPDSAVKQLTESQRQKWSTIGDRYHFAMATRIMDLFGESNDEWAATHYPSSVLGENTAAIILSSKYPLLERKYMILGIFDTQIWSAIVGIVVLLTILIKISLVTRSIIPADWSEICLCVSGLLTRTCVNFRNLHLEASVLGGYSLPYRLFLMCLIGFAFLLSHYFGGQFLSFLLYEPTYRYRTFADIAHDAPAEMKILVWQKSGADKYLTQAGGHYAQVASRLTSLPGEELQTRENILLTAQGKQLMIVNERQLDRTMARYERYLDLHPGDEKVGKFRRAKAIRRGSSLGPLISDTLQLMLERGMIAFEDQRTQTIQAKTAQLQIDFKQLSREAAQKSYWLKNDVTDGTSSTDALAEQMTVRSIRLADLEGSFLGLVILGLSFIIWQLTLLGIRRVTSYCPRKPPKPHLTD